MKILLIFLMITLTSLSANGKSKNTSPFDLWECSGLVTDGKEVFKQFKAINFKDKKTQELIYLKASALASLYEAYCKD